jgi:hypothetical protein
MRILSEKSASLETTCSEGDRGIDVGRLKRRVLPEYLLSAFAGTEELQNRLGSNPLATDGGFPVADLGIDCDPVQKLSVVHTLLAAAKAPCPLA